MADLLVINPRKPKRGLRGNPDLLVINPKPLEVGLVAAFLVVGAFTVAGIVKSIRGEKKESA